MSTAWEGHPGWQGEPVIELGEDYALADVINRANRPGGRWAALRYRLGIPLLAILFLLTASAPVPAPSLTRVAQISFTDEASLLVHGGNAFVLEDNKGHNQLQAYDLSGGTRLWSAPVAEVASDAMLRSAGGVVLVTMDAEYSTGTHTEAFDEVSGKRLWAGDDGIFTILPDGDILTESQVTFPTSDAPSESSTGPGWTFERIALRSGRVEWRAGIGVTCDPQVLTDPRTGSVIGLVTLCDDPVELDSINLDTGRVGPRQRIITVSAAPKSSQGLAGYLPSGYQLPGLSGAAQLIAIGDVALVSHVGGPSAVVDGYLGPALTPTWSGVSIQAWQHAVACPPELCLTSIYGDVTIDPATGVVTQGGPSSPVSATGAAIVMSPQSSGSRSIYARVLTVGDGIAAPVPAPARGNAWVERLAPGGVSVRQTLGKISGVGVDACLISGAYLACSTEFGRMTFWLLR